MESGVSLLVMTFCFLLWIAIYLSILPCHFPALVPRVLADSAPRFLWCFASSRPPSPQLLGVSCCACLLRGASSLFNTERSLPARHLVETAYTACSSRGCLMPLALTAAVFVSFLNPPGLCGFVLRRRGGEVGREGGRSLN